MRMALPVTSVHPRTGYYACLLLAALAAAHVSVFPGPVQAQPQKDGPTKSRIVLWRYSLDSLNSAGDAYLAGINPEDKKSTRLTITADEGIPTFPIALSADGRSVAYTKGVTEGDNASFQVYVRSLDDRKKPGRGLGVNGYCACWSADGRRVVVVNDQDGSIEHYLVDVKTKDKKTISLPKVEAPQDVKGRVGHVITDWSKDGQWFLTMCLHGDQKEAKVRLYRVKSDGSETHAIKGAESGRWGRFSPDGKRILYTSPDEKGQARLFVIDTAGGKPVRLSPELNGSIDEAGFCWSPDGKRVAYLWLNSERPQFGQEYEMFLMVIDADGQNQVTVLSEKTPFVKPIRYPQWR
jgi:Tol biopolymer transport system component